MANRVYISILGPDITFSSVCTEDISVQAQSQFTRIGDFIPSIQSLASMLANSQDIVWGEVSNQMMNVVNALDVPIWQKTEPVKVTMDLNFFIKTSGYYDVWRPTMLLQSMGVLSKNNSTHSLITPGINISNIGDLNTSDKNIISNKLGANSLQKSLALAQGADMAEVLATKGEIPDASSFSTQSKLCSVYIPSIVYLPIAIIEVAQPTWSIQLS